MTDAIPAPDAAAIASDAPDAADVVAANGPEFAGLADQVVHALRERPMLDFDLRPAVLVEGAVVRGVVRLRIDGSRWSLTPVEAAALSVIIRCGDREGRRMRASDAFADAFALAARLALSWSEGVSRFGVAADVHGAAA